MPNNNDWRAALVSELVYDANDATIVYSVATYYADGGAVDDFDVVLFDNVRRTVVGSATFNADGRRWNYEIGSTELTDQTVGSWIGQLIDADQTADQTD